MEPQDQIRLVILTTVISGAISVLTQVFQYIFPVKKSQPQQFNELSQAVSNIATSYDNLMETLNKRITKLEADIKEKNKRIDELEKENRLLRDKLEDLEQQVVEVKNGKH